MRKIKKIKNWFQVNRNELEEIVAVVLFTAATLAVANKLSGPEYVKCDDMEEFEQPVPYKVRNQKRKF